LYLSIVKQVHEFDPVIYPYKVWVCGGVPEDLADRFRIDTDGTIPKFNKRSFATTYCVYRLEDFQVGILIVFSCKKYMTMKHVAHESRHAGDMLFELIGDNPHHSEPAAYFTGWVAECCEKVKLSRL